MLHSWIVKALVQKLVSFLPFKHQINFFFQKRITRGVELTDLYFTDRLIHIRNHVKYYQEITGKSIPEKTLELGTGWYPVIPIYLFLRGVNSIYSIDIANHIRKNYTRRTIKKFLLELDGNKIFAEKECFISERIAQLRSVCSNTSISEQEMLTSLGISASVGDVKNDSFDDEFFDLIHSNNTFEHINPDELKQILVAFERMLKKGGVMSHFIDMTDHFAHFDRSITIYNFLRFSQKEWSCIDNSIQPQNRLRVTDYVNIYNDLCINNRIEELRPGNPEEVKSLHLNELYSNYPVERLAVSHCQLISSK